MGVGLGEGEMEGEGDGVGAGLRVVTSLGMRTAKNKTTRATRPIMTKLVFLTGLPTGTDTWVFSSSESLAPREARLVLKGVSARIS